MKRIFTLFLLILLSGTAFAQQDPIFSQYIFNGLIVNPAYAGSRGTLGATLMSRKQWWGFEGSPFSNVLTVHSPIDKKRNALGGYAIYDQLGVTRSININAVYSYMLPIRDIGTLAMGLSGGFTNYNNGINTLRMKDMEVEQLGLNHLNTTKPNVGAGVYFYDEKWYVSMSVPEIITGRLVQQGDWSTRMKQDRLYLFSAGLLFPLNIHLKFRPSILGRYVVNAPMQFDVNAALLINDRLWLGVGYRTGDAMIFNLAVQISDFFRLGYAYDLSTTRLSQAHVGSHELMIGFDLKHKFKQAAPLRHIDDPRYF